LTTGTGCTHMRSCCSQQHVQRRATLQVLRVHVSPRLHQGLHQAARLPLACNVQQRRPGAVPVIDHAGGHEVDELHRANGVRQEHVQATHACPQPRPRGGREAGGGGRAGAGAGQGQGGAVPQGAGAGAGRGHKSPQRAGGRGGGGLQPRLPLEMTPLWGPLPAAHDYCGDLPWVEGSVGSNPGVLSRSSTLQRGTTRDACSHSRTKSSASCWGVGAGAVGVGVLTPGGVAASSSSTSLTARVGTRDPGAPLPARPSCTTRRIHSSLGPHQHCRTQCGRVPGHSQHMGGAQAGKRPRGHVGRARRAGE
jgi:hypothetical protein